MIILPLPPSVNATYKTGKGNFYKSKAAKDWEQEAGWEIKRQWKKIPLAGKLYMCIWWYFKRERDISGGLKILEDLLQKMQVYYNDSQLYHTVMRKGFDKKNPRVEIEIELLSDYS